MKTNLTIKDNTTLMGQLIAEIAKFGGDSKKHASQLARILLPHIESAITEAEKAYGGCHKCYGKGYATYKTQHTGYGTDGDIGGFEGHYKRDIPVEMKFCSCGRGKQLETLVNELKDNTNESLKTSERNE